MICEQFDVLEKQLRKAISLYQHVCTSVRPRGTEQPCFHRTVVGEALH
jgi:hypothetical protein